MRNLIWKTKPNVCVEIGVFAGKSLLNTAIQLRDNGVGMVYGIDPWRKEEAIANLTADDASPEWWDSIDLDAVHYDCMRAIWQRELDNVVIIRAQSELVFQLFQNNSVDILYVDGGHEEKVALQDCELYFPKVKLGGHIWLDDTNYASLQKSVSFMRSQCVMIKDFGHCQLYKKQYEMERT